MTENVSLTFSESSFFDTVLHEDPKEAVQRHHRGGLDRRAHQPGFAWRRLDLLAGLGHDTLQCGPPRECSSAVPARTLVVSTAGSGFGSAASRQVFLESLRGHIEGDCGASPGSENEGLTKADFLTPILRPLLMNWVARFCCHVGSKPQLWASAWEGLLVAQSEREAVWAAAITDEAEGSDYSPCTVAEFQRSHLRRASQTRCGTQSRRWRTLSERTRAASRRPSHKRRRHLRS